MIVFVGDYMPQTKFRQPEMIKGSRIVANLECIIGDAATPLKAHSIVMGEASLDFVRYSGVTAFNLANNHVYDAGAEAFDRMVNRLSTLKSIQFFGLTDRPYAKLDCNGLRIAVIGCLEPCRARGPRLLREEHVVSVISQVRLDADRVYVTPHWGKEGELACHPSPQQMRRAREWIAAGADGVFGHHSHTIHGHEVVNGKPVYYSLGNYQFDHVEAHDYPLAAFGLAVRLDPSLDDPAVAVRRSYLHQQTAGAVSVEPKDAKQLEQHFKQLSMDLMHWNTLTWARHVGPIYISKSRNSWRKRLRNNLIKTLPLWAVWNVLPSTLLLRLGTLVRAQAFLDRIEKLGRSLPQGSRSKVS
jgi:poly-gamma-glutamate synthesis protein (capsule biosynthesis protein)